MDSGVARTELFLRTLKFMPIIASKIEATLKGKNLLPLAEGANSFL